jgi:methyl-accepting chemotaxis protein
MKLSNLPIGTRLGAGFALVLLMLIGVAYLGIHGMQQSNQSLHHVVTVNIKKMDALEDMSRSIHVVSRVVRSIALLSDEAQAKLEHKKIDEARAHYDEAFSDWKKCPLMTMEKICCQH